MKKWENEDKVTPLIETGKPNLKNSKQKNKK